MSEASQNLLAVGIILVVVGSILLIAGASAFLTLKAVINLFIHKKQPRDRHGRFLRTR